jgi:hypothetical protein
MAIEYQKRTAQFLDTVGVEEADALLEWLQKQPKGRIDLSACTHLHAANLQVLMAAKAVIGAWPKDANLRVWLKSTMPNA